jgi:hypothetical protein
MITISTFSDLQAAINAQEPNIEIRGVLSAPGQTLQVHQTDGLGNQSGMTVIHGGTLRCAGIVADGFRKLKFSEMEIYAEAAGITVRNGIQLYLEDVYDCCRGDSLRLESIAAVWGRGLQHTAAVAGQATVAQRIGASAQGFESVDMDAVLTEGHFSAVRVGGAGNAVNMWFRNYKIDRPVSAGFLINPSGAAGARNINIIDPWINSADYPIAINGAETTGIIERVNIRNGEYLGCAHPPVTAWQTAGNVSYNLGGQQIFGVGELG